MYTCVVCNAPASLGENAEIVRTCNHTTSGVAANLSVHCRGVGAQKHTTTNWLVNAIKSAVNAIRKHNTKYGV